MGKYLLKRLILLLPTVWLIGSLAFLLSRLIPGTYFDRFLEAETTSIRGNVAILTREKYLDNLRITELNKPTFYFTLKTAAQPDTLQNVFPVSHQVLLQGLVQEYGNWVEISDYYLAVLNLQSQIDLLSIRNNSNSNLQQNLLLLLQKTDPLQIAAIINILQKEVTTEQMALKRPIDNVDRHYKKMLQRAQPWRNLLPAIKLNGFNNAYHSWFLGLVQGNLGYSYRDRRPVLQVLTEVMSNTLVLLVGSLFILFWLSIELALTLSKKARPKLRQIVLPILYTVESIPLFIIALLLLSFLAGSGYLTLFPISGLGLDAGNDQSWFQILVTRLHHLLLPALCLIIAGLPFVTTQLYQEMQHVFASEFIKTARAKGLSEKVTLRRHVFRNSLLPLITTFTGYLPALISGALVLEVIFAIPGTGRLLAESVLARDYPVVLGLVLFIALLKAFSHLVADFLYFVADPRTRQL